MQTFIHGDGIWDESKAMDMTHESEKDRPKAAIHELHQAGVADQISTKSDIFYGGNCAKAANFV